MTLKQYLSNGRGGYKRGSITRIAEHLKLSRTAIQNFLNGRYMPCITTARRIQDAIHAKIPLDAKKPGPRKNKCYVQVVEETHVTRQLSNGAKNKLTRSRK
jgi:transcriptional regulator with XRE-family HTH domain